MTNDLVESSDEIMPHMHVWDAFHAESALIPVSRLNGITNAIVAPKARTLCLARIRSFNLRARRPRNAVGSRYRHARELYWR